MLTPPLVLAVAQPPCRAGDVAANAQSHAAAVHAAGARVVVFPELSLTGYELAAPSVRPDDPRLAPLIDACAALNAVALVGAPVDGPDGPDGRPTIATVIVDGGGAAVAYRKQWLGGAEPARFAAGDGPAVIEVDGWRLGLGICKDLGVPRHAADTAAVGMDAYVAGTVHAVAEVDEQDARARRVAADHGVWVAVASFAGPTGGGYDQTAGGSAIWSPDGAVVARAGPEAGGVAAAALVRAT